MSKSSSGGAVTITRRLEFDAGHRVLGHESKCANLHGHRYVAAISVRAQHLDPIGRVIDFGCIKTLIGGWIDDHWDHTMILHPEDPLLLIARASPEDDVPLGWRETTVFGPKKPFIMPESNPNPTAENMAQVLFRESQRLLTEADSGLRVCRIRLYETPNCWADY